MNEMTRQELDERLLDYLYDELGPSERSAFERALPAHPEVAKEVAAHRATRKAYQALPREAAPLGLLDAVLAEADAEAARRAAPVASAAEAPRAVAAPAVERVPFWEKLRRVLFQPTFAMAMALLLVVGVSVIGNKKGEPPGMPAASDSQHIPPVAVTQPPAVAAAGAPVEQAEAARVVSADVPTPPPVTATDEAVAPKVAEPEDREKAAQPTSGAGALALGPAMKADPQKAPETKQAAYAGADDAKHKAEGERRQAAADATKSANGFRFENDQIANELDGRPLGGVVGDEAGDARRPSNTIDPQGRAQPESPVAPAKTEAEPPKREVLAEEAPVTRDFKPEPDANKAKEPPAPAPTAPQPSDALKNDKPADTTTKDLRKEATTAPGLTPTPTTNERGRTDVAPSTPPVPVDAPKKGDEYQVERFVLDRSRVPATDDDEKKTEGKKPVLTPPAPNAQQLWTTYQQQDAAGAYADAQRSIDTLAKLEGESSRVRQARAELKKKLEALSKQGTTSPSRAPPDVPGGPPK